MIYEEDYLLRQIKTMIQTVYKIFKRKLSLEEDMEPREEDGELYYRLLEIDNINDTEDYLFKSLDRENSKILLIGVSFYDRINELTDEELEAEDFSREEIEIGLRDLLEYYNIPYFGLRGD